MQEKGKYLIVVGGPTAAGKTRLAIDLAQQFQTEIINADSRQFYQELNIGVARPDEEELAAVSHHFVADRSLKEPLSAGAFADLASQKIQELFKRNNYVVLSGGSGLFIRGIIYGFDEFPEIPETVRKEVDLLFQNRGLTGLQEEVAIADPTYYATVDQQNPARLRRALEVIKTSSKPYSSFRQQQKKPLNYQPIFLAAYRSREELYQRINHRVDLMMEEGLVEEVRGLREYKDLSVMKTVGYQELFPYFNGEYDLSRANELIKQHSRRYAKRQITWLRRDGYWFWVDPQNLKEALDIISLSVQTNISLDTKSYSEFENLDEFKTGLKPYMRKGDQLMILKKSHTGIAALVYNLKAKQALIHQYIREEEEENLLLLLKQQLVRRASV